MLTPLGDDVWHEIGPVQFLGLHLTVTMTVMRLADGLLVHSPLPATRERTIAVSALGPVAHLYAPNAYHHQWIGAWSASFPHARVHAPEELARKRRDLRIDRFHDRDAAQDMAGLEEVPIRGFRLKETVLVHRRSRTLIVTDLVHNIGRPQHPWTRLYTKAMGFYDRVALSRVLRWTSFDDKRAARRSVDQLLEHEFDRLIVGHGTSIAHEARELLAAATDWLPRRPGAGLPGAGSSLPRLLSPTPCG